MTGILSPAILYRIFFVFSLIGIIFTIIYLTTLSSTVITQTNIISHFGWLIVGIISVIIMGQMYENNITYNITLIVGLYILYAFMSLINLIHFYKIMLDGKSFNNTVIKSYRMTIGIINIVIFVLFGFTLFMDIRLLGNPQNINNEKLKIGNVVITIIYLVCMILSIYLLYSTTSKIITYSITDG
jgi:hypothetical protein